MERALVPTGRKIAFIDTMSDYGFARIEVSSYTSAKAISTLADAEASIERFDAASRGLGDYPYAPGASGNVNKEKLVHMFASIGYDTWVGVHVLLEVVRSMSGLDGQTV